MAQKKLLTNGNVFKRTDNRWGGVVWYSDEQGERRRKSFSGTTKQEVNRKITDYIAAFNESKIASQESKKRLRESMQSWLELFKFPSVERTTYDRCECTARNQIYPLLGEYFRYLTEQEHIVKNPMTSVPMIKKSNFLAAQEKDNLHENETVTVFTKEEIEKFKTEAFREWSNGKRQYRQAAAYILMLNTGLRTGEMLGLLNSDIDIKNKTLTVRQGVKEIFKRDVSKTSGGMEIKIEKPKSASSKRTVPLNATAIAMIEDLHREAFFGENTPLVCDEKGGYTKPVNFRKRYYRILKAAGI